MKTRIAKFKHHQTPFVWKQAFLAEKQTSSSVEFNQKLLKIQPKHWPDIPEWFSEACIKKYEEGFEPFWNKDTHSYVFMEKLERFFDSQKPEIWEQAIHNSTLDLPNLMSYENHWDCAPQILSDLARKYKLLGYNPVEKILPRETVFIEGIYEVTKPEREIILLQKNETFLNERKFAA